MNKIAYFDCPTGIAGDMCIGSLVHAGVPLEYLIEKLNLLGISTEYQLRTELVHRNTQQATKFYVDLAADLSLKPEIPLPNPIPRKRNPRLSAATTIITGKNILTVMGKQRPKLATLIIATSRKLSRLSSLQNCLRAWKPGVWLYFAS